MQIRKLLVGAIIGGGIALAAVLFVEQFLYTYYRRSEVVAIMAVLVLLGVSGLVLYRNRTVKIPIAAIVKIVVVIFLLNVSFDVIIATATDLYYIEAYDSTAELDLLGNILEAFFDNAHWLVGGLIIGVMTAISLPALSRKRLLGNRPFLVILAILVFVESGLIRFTMVRDTANGYGVSGYLALPAVLGAMLLGARIGVLQAREAGELPGGPNESIQKSTEV